MIFRKMSIGGQIYGEDGVSPWVSQDAEKRGITNFGMKSQKLDLVLK